ncbi:hypothetical protein PR048_019812 [Dryococelus australis]|uniref:Secreted protein n=1 Tax=Dryococelus australis TaxID=614101 RepID=A0ABQ9H4K1_9NEOP|nr:hypothetical protein PR048_019812 [Dryococelus australis]
MLVPTFLIVLFETRLLLCGAAHVGFHLHHPEPIRDGKFCCNASRWTVVYVLATAEAGWPIRPAVPPFQWPFPAPEWGKQAAAPTSAHGEVSSGARERWGGGGGRWESCRTMPLVGGFSRGSHLSPAPSFRHRTILTSITLLGSENFGVKSRPNLFTSLIAVNEVKAMPECLVNVKACHISMLVRTVQNDRSLGNGFVIP